MSASWRVRRLVDLSHPVHDGMPVYPGDPAVRTRPATTVAEHGYNVLHLELGSQSGTHVDAPYHFLEGGARIDELPLELFVGPARVVDVRGKPARGRIGWDDLAPHAEHIVPGCLLVLHTGWDQHWGTPAYFAHPCLTAEAAERIVAAGVRTVAIDALSVDETAADGEPPGGFPAHDAVLGAGGVIVENLCNLAALRTDSPVLSVLPLRLAAADGAPVRAVGLELEP